MSSQIKIDCAVLSYNQKRYLVPMNALAEIISVENGISFLTDPNDPEIKIHRIAWNEMEIPLLSIDFDAFKIKGLRFEKIVIIRAIFSKNAEWPPFFALYINEKIWREVLSCEMIRWVDENKKTAEIIKKKSKIEVIIFDLICFSQQVEHNLLKIAKKRLQ